MGRAADVSCYTEEEIALWEKIIEKQGVVFRTKKGLTFQIAVKGNELFVDRRKKSVTRASVNLAYQRWKEDPDCGPKALGVFGASYLWGVFKGIARCEKEERE